MKCTLKSAESNPCSWSQIFIRRPCSMFTEILMSAFNTSAGILSGPAALLFLRDLIAFSTSILVGDSQDISSSWLAGGSIGGSIGGGLLRSCWKCSTHPLCYFSVVFVGRRPFKSLIWWFVAKLSWEFLSCIIKCLHIMLHSCNLCFFC